MRVFVYGTLRRGQPNHGWLEGAPCLGECRTAPRYPLVDLGPYPMLGRGGRTAVLGEVYAINRRLLARLDVLEDYPRDYHRALIATPWGRAWVYLRQRPPAGRRLSGGDWCERAHPRP